jgi:hypothetical protein
MTILTTNIIFCGSRAWVGADSLLQRAAKTWFRQEFELDATGATTGPAWPGHNVAEPDGGCGFVKSRQKHVAWLATAAGLACAKITALHARRGFGWSA